jgi:hypothetical protein
MRSPSRLAATAAMLAVLPGALPLPVAVAAPAPGAPAATPGAGLSCDDSLKTSFKPDALTQVTLVHAYAKGDDLGSGGRGPPRKAEADACMVKLMIGPGHAGAAGAPSTSQGIGVEVWLPARGAWNRRVHLLGGGGYAGDATVSSLTQSSGQAAQVAMTEGAVSAVTDTGHVGAGGFAFTPDGRLNADLWRDFSSRSLHQMVLKTKALAGAYYGSAPEHTYWDGCSTGGRQGLKLVQDYPDDVDAALVGAPAINWTRFITAELYPQIVMLRDLGGPIAAPKLTLASSAAVSDCDAALNGQHDGFISQPDTCRYDPAKDPKVLCVSDGGQNSDSVCLTQREAQAIDKIWYGETTDGSAPDPARDNGVHAELAPGQLWFGLARGANLALLAGGGAFNIATTQVALDVSDVRIAPPSVPGGQDGWKALSYADLASAQTAGVAHQAELADINTDKADLSAFRARGGKILMYHGLSDQLIFPEGSRHYYQAVEARTGGPEATRAFFRHYEIPGMGHCQGVGSVNGVAGTSPPAAPPLPKQGQLYGLLVAWVEDKHAPDDIILSGPTISRPICTYPQTAVYRSGDRGVAASYACRPPGRRAGD